MAGTVSRTYDNNFWVTETQVNGAHASAFIYDNDGLVHAAGNLVILRDSANGLVTGTTLGGVATSKTYNEYGEASSESAERGVSAIYSAVLTRDLLGRVAGKTETIDGAQRLYGYAYDLAGRLISASSDGQVTAYTYDTNGNRLSKEDASGRAEGAYDAQDRLFSYGDNTYTHTANGELLLRTAPDGTASYDYDALGNLRAVTLPDGTDIEYIIDGANRRIGKKINGTIERGWLYVNGLNPIAELDASGSVVSTFVYATKPNVPDYMVHSGVTYRIISDHLGSPLLVVNASTGEVAQRMDYDEFGIVTSDTNPGFQPFGFAGGLYDSQTKLVRFGARDYDAEIGRWTSKDPILFSGGDTNLYGYVMGDPVNGIDPLGLVDLNLFSQSDALYQYANSAQSPPNTFTVGAHGSPSNVYDPYGGKIYAPQLANMIRSNPKYQTGATIRLMSCNTGMNPISGGQSSFAQILSNELGVNVEGPNGIVWYYPGGATLVAPAIDNNINRGPDLGNQGSYILFTP